jgi:SHS2 domain-containing protein
MPYRYLDELSIADVGFRATGRSLGEVFASAWEASLRVMIEDPAALRPSLRRRILLQGESLELLLVDFLQELLYHKDAEGLLLRLESCHVERSGEGYLLRAAAAGETVDPERHRLGRDVKAVTFHRLRLERRRRGWELTVVLDI